VAEILDRLLVVVAATVVALLGPTLAYTLYPGEPPIQPIDEPVPSFVEALSHCSSYRGMVTVAGTVVDASPYMVVVETGRGRVMVLLHGCWAGQGVELAPEDLARRLLGMQVVVTGQLYLARHWLAMKPVSIETGHATYTLVPCETWAGKHHHHRCPMCPHGGQH
jgi:RNase P/RNase MRP subunit p29